MNEVKLAASGSVSYAAIDSRLRYLGEATARITEVRCRVRGAQHYLRRLEHERAADELLHVINEARKLRIHLAAWDSYVAQPKERP